MCTLYDQIKISEDLVSTMEVNEPVQTSNELANNNSTILCRILQKLQNFAEEIGLV